MRIENYLREMANIPALAGHEQKMAAYMSKKFIEMGYETKIDTFGNVIAKVEGRDPDAPKIMIFAHMDQLGFMVRRIEDDGFLRIERVGGIPEKVLPATPIQVQTESGEMVEGLIGVKAHHVTPPEEKYKVDPYMSLYVDIGARSRQEVLGLGIDVGSPVVYKPNFVKLQGNRVYGTSLDDRTGCTTVLELGHVFQDNKPDATVYLVGSVQEEYNLRGAMMASRSICPDMAISIDGGGASDTPDLKGRGEISLGNGPAMSLYNFHGRGTLNGTIPHPAMVRMFKEAGKKTGVNIQKSASIGGLTDLSYVQLEGKGIPAIDIGAPGRYAHSPVESCDLSDIAELVKWVAAFVYDVKKGIVFKR